MYAHNQYINYSQSNRRRIGVAERIRSGNVVERLNLQHKRRNIIENRKNIQINQCVNNLYSQSIYDADSMINRQYYDVQLNNVNTTQLNSNNGNNDNNDNNDSNDSNDNNDNIDDLDNSIQQNGDYDNVINDNNYNNDGYDNNGNNDNENYDDNNDCDYNIIQQIDNDDDQLFNDIIRKCDIKIDDDNSEIKDDSEINDRYVNEVINNDIDANTEQQNEKNKTQQKRLTFRRK